MSDMEGIVKMKWRNEMIEMTPWKTIFSLEKTGFWGEDINVMGYLDNEHGRTSRTHKFTWNLFLEGHRLVLAIFCYDKNYGWLTVAPLGEYNLPFRCPEPQFINLWLLVNQCLIHWAEFLCFLVDIFSWTW